MTLQDLVPDRELCEKWKQAGGRQDTLFYWLALINNNLPKIITQVEALNTPPSITFAAPLEGELMEWLPTIMQTESNDYLLTVHPWKDVKYVSYENDRGVYEQIEDKKLANALMLMALEVKKDET